MHNFLVKLLLLISTLVSSMPVAQLPTPPPVVNESSILSYYYAIPSQYFIAGLIKETPEERKAALDNLIEDERMGKNKDLFDGEDKNYRKDNPKNILAVVDEKNYYLYMNPNESYGDWNQSFEITVFIKSNGEHVIAVESHDCGLWCGSEFTKMFLLTYENGKWTDVTKELLPVKEIDKLVQNEIKVCEKNNVKNSDQKETHAYCVDHSAGIAYALPKIGTTIFSYNGLSETKFELDWRKDKFEFKALSAH